MSTRDSHPGGRRGRPLPPRPVTRDYSDRDRPGLNTGLFYLYGRRPILEALRLDLVQAIEISSRAHGQAIQQIRRDAERQNVPIRTVESFENEDGLVMQGVRALAKPPRVRHDLRSFVADLPEHPAPLLLMLDGVLDPHNVGAILRTAEAARVNAVIVREHRQARITEAVVKTSAGAAYLVPIFEVINLSQILKILAEMGFWSVAAVSGEGSMSYVNYEWKGKTILIVGAEGAGVSDLVKKTADAKVNIPMFGKIESLNVSVATGIMLYKAAQARGLTILGEP